MADFEKAFELVLKNEGGYVNDPDDAGGETYKGVARNRNANWAGWINVDLLKQRGGFPQNLEQDIDLQILIKDLYAVKYWHTVRGDQIENQDIATSIFDFGVNAGPATSSRMAQLSCGATVDGVIGDKTLEKLNQIEPELFLAQFKLAKIARYIHICKKNHKYKKFLLGWTTRTLEGA